MWNGTLYIQLRDGRFVPYVEWIEARRRDPVEELRWRRSLEVVVQVLRIGQPGEVEQLREDLLEAFRLPGPDLE